MPHLQPFVIHHSRVEKNHRIWKIKSTVFNKKVFKHFLTMSLAVETNQTYRSADSGDSTYER